MLVSSVVVAVVVEWRALKDGKVLLCVIAVWGLVVEGLVVLGVAPASRESSLRWKSCIFMLGLGFGDVAGRSLSLAVVMAVGVEFGEEVGVEEVEMGFGTGLGVEGNVVCSGGPSLWLTVVRVEGVGFGVGFGVKEVERVGVRGAIIAYVGAGVGIGEEGVGFVVGVSAEGKGVGFGVRTEVGGACMGTVGIGACPADLAVEMGVSPIGVWAAADAQSDEVLRTAALVTLLLPVPSKLFALSSLGDCKGCTAFFFFLASAAGEPGHDNRKDVSIITQA